MKKLLSVILAGTLGCSLVACAEAKEVTNEPNPCTGLIKMDTLIQDVNGEHKCLWNDGKIFFDDFFARPGLDRQSQKNATLSLQKEYDMWFNMANEDLDLANYYYPVEFEYDETKIEIKPNPDKESHFILKVNQPCEQEEIYITLTDKSWTDEYFAPLSRTGLITTISTEE